MAKRKTITKKVRFEVFKRDSFTCQYCGQAAPDVVLHIDHIEPVAKGGDNDILNLLTSCAGCNAGKSDRRLDDQTTLAKQRQQIAELNERREQLEMMVAWRTGMKSIKDSEIDALSAHWQELLDGRYHLNPSGQQGLRKIVRKFGVNAVMEAMTVVVESYVKIGADGQYDHDSVQHAYRKIGGVCAMEAMPEDKRRLGISVGMVGHIETGIRGISPRIAMRVESDTDGLIKRGQLRPDLWGDKASAA